MNQEPSSSHRNFLPYMHPAVLRRTMSFGASATARWACSIALSVRPVASLIQADISQAWGHSGAISMRRSVSGSARSARPHCW